MDSSSITPVMPVGGGMDGFGGGSAFIWIFGLLILLGMFNGGFGFGGNRGPAPATQEYVQTAIDNAGINSQLQQIALSSANNNYETAQLVTAQTRDIMTQGYTNQINAVQGFNQLQQQIAALGSRMDSCCCEIKTTLLQDKYDAAARELAKTQNEAVNAAQSQYLLGVMGKWVANAPAVI